MALPVLGELEQRHVQEALATGWISSQGRFIPAFEERFAAFCGVGHAVAVTSGTAALHLAFMALGIGPGDEVILPPITHIATANAVRLCGATPVLADCEPRTWNLDPERAAERVGPRTRAVVAVHLFGHPCDMAPLQDLGPDLVEDAAQAHGAEYRGRRAGSLGRVGCFSFYANKIVTTGEGGMLTTDDGDLARRAAKLRDQAYEPERRFWHREFGWNYRMTNMQAGVGLGQMEQVDRFVAIRRRNGRLYSSLLEGLPGLVLPVEEPWARSVCWMYSFLVEPDCPRSREELALRLREAGIDSRPFFHPIHLQPLYRDLFAGQSFPVAERLGERGLSLPCGNDLTEPEVERIAGVVREALR